MSGFSKQKRHFASCAAKILCSGKIKHTQNLYYNFYKAPYISIHNNRVGIPSIVKEEHVVTVILGLGSRSFTNKQNDPNDQHPTDKLNLIS